MWTTFSVMVVISMAIRQIIMDFTLRELREQCHELEKEMADLEERVQSQPLEIIDVLQRNVDKAIDSISRTLLE